MKKYSPSPDEVPRNPVRGFIYGIIWLVIAILTGSVFISYVVTGTSISDTTSIRVGDLIMVGPFTALVASIFCFVCAGLALGPYTTYLRATSRAQRHKLQRDAWKIQKPPTGLVLVPAIISYLGLLALMMVLVVNYSSISSLINGMNLFVSIFLLIGLFSAALTEVLVRTIRAKL